MTDDTTTTSAMPRSEHLWDVLRIVFGSRLLDATVTVLTAGGNPDGHDVTFTTYTFPKTVVAERAHGIGDAA